MPSEDPKCNAIAMNGSKCQRPAKYRISFKGNDVGRDLGPILVEVHVCAEHAPKGVLRKAVEPHARPRLLL